MNNSKYSIPWNLMKIYMTNSQMNAISYKLHVCNTYICVCVYHYLYVYIGVYIDT